MTIRPIEIWGHWGPPTHVCMVLEELSLPYTVNKLEFNEVKQESYVALNPNGRLPTMHDPNTGITIWESGAIILYLVDKYDADASRISFPLDSPLRYQTQQWLAFQISGQGPYFGQATWFARFHATKIPSAIDRYVAEILRVTAILDAFLAKAVGSQADGAEGDRWLVGGRPTYADLAFVTWAAVGEGLLAELGHEPLVGRFPHYARWMAAMDRRESVRKIKDLMAQGRRDHGLS